MDNFHDLEVINLPPSFKDCKTCQHFNYTDGKASCLFQDGDDPEECIAKDIP